MTTKFVALSLRLVWRPLPTYEAKDRVLALQGPFVLLSVLVVWLTSLWIAWGLILWPLATGGLWDALRESGSSLLTLGFAPNPDAAATFVHFLSATSGLVVIALQIAYLPVLYNAFSQREITVTTLESRAGAPAWGPEILWRHHRVGILDSMPDFYAEWERWCANVAETHSTYPVLISFRSPNQHRSWATGLLAVMDSAAMYLALCPDTAPSEARLCLRMGFTSLRTIAAALGLKFDPDPMPDAPIDLTYDEFASAVRVLEESEFPTQRTAHEAWPHFHGWRVNYEELAYAVADYVVAVPGPWSGPRKALGGIVVEPRRPIDRTPDDPGGRDFSVQRTDIQPRKRPKRASR